MSADVFSHRWLGGLFGDRQAAAIWAPDRQIAHMLRIEAAYTRARAHAGTWPKVRADRAARVIETCIPDLDALRSGTARDGVPVPELIRQIKAAAGDDSDLIHVGMTSQDVIDTALSLTLRDINELLAARLAELCAALSALSSASGHVEIMGRTRMQAALPIRFAHRAASWATPLADHAAALSAQRSSVERLQLGGPVGDRAGLGAAAPVVAAEMARQLDLHDAPAWHSTRAQIAAHAGRLSLITGSLGKMGQDVCLMAQQGIDALQIRGGGGSSAMPHKQNPVLAELLVTLARFNATQVAGMHHALVHEQERSGVAWGLEWMILPQMTMATARSLAVAQDLCARITIRDGHSPA